MRLKPAEKQRLRMPANRPPRAEFAGKSQNLRSPEALSLVMLIVRA
jgi:hypothetical protein